MANGSEEARKFALIMAVSASVSALLALAFWFDVFGLDLDDTPRLAMVALFAVVCIMEVVLGRVLYLRKVAEK